MKLTQLKALDKLVKSDKTRDFLQHVFISGEYIYACTSCIVIEIRAKELIDNAVNIQFAAVDMDKAETCNDEMRYVKLDDCLLVDDYACWNVWRNDYFSRFFDMNTKHGCKYDPKYLIKIFQVFKSFGINVTFMRNETNNFVTYEGFNGNYEIRALLMPLF